MLLLFLLLLSLSLSLLLLSAIAFGCGSRPLLSAIAFGSSFRMLLSAIAFGCGSRPLLSAIALGYCFRMLLSAKVNHSMICVFQKGPMCRGARVKGSMYCVEQQFLHHNTHTRRILWRCSGPVATSFCSCSATQGRSGSSVAARSPPRVPRVPRCTQPESRDGTRPAGGPRR